MSDEVKATTVQGAEYLAKSQCQPGPSAPGGEAAPGAEGGQRDEDRACLRFAWAEGIESGDTGVLDFKDLKAEGRRRLAEQTKTDPKGVP